MPDDKTKSKVEKTLGSVSEGSCEDAFAEEFGKEAAGKSQNKSLTFLKAEDLTEARVFAFEGNTQEEIEEPGKGGEPGAVKKLSFWTLRDRKGGRYSLSESHQLMKLRTRVEVKPGDYVSLHLKGEQSTRRGLGKLKLWDIRVMAKEAVPEAKRF